VAGQHFTSDAELQSRLLDVGSIRVWTPSDVALTFDDEGAFVIHYLNFVGGLLANDHFATAQQRAQQFEAEYERVLDARRT
jgi:hypothetical protein